MADDKIRLDRALGDRYCIERKLGEGATAFVYLARDLRHRRSVAIKVLREELTSTLGADRFLQEIRIAAGLMHPHVLPLYDSGEADGLLYYVMPYHAGESLRERLDRDGPLPAEDVSTILRQVLDGLGHAHAQGVFHRDIKPDNVLLQGDHAVVADFGVARALSGAGTQALTVFGTTVGTPAYMAPEQAAAEPSVDHRADIYAVGAMAYELLVGEPPFTGGSARSVLTKHITETPVPIRQRRSSIPGGLAGAVMRCLEKRPEDRFQSAFELRSVVESAETSTSSAATHERRGIAAAARPLVVWGMTLMALSIGAFGLAGPIGGGDAAPRRAVVDVFDNRTGDPQLAPIGEMLQDWLTEGLHGSGLLEVVPTLTARQASGFVRDEAAGGRVRDPIGALSKETGADVVVSGSIYRDGSQLRIQAAVTDAVRGRAIASVPLTVGSTEDVSGLLDEVRDRFLGALGASLDRRLRAQVGVDGRAPRFDAYALLNEGLKYYAARDYRDASRRFLEAFELDSAYVIPLLYASLSLRNHGEWARSDSVVEILERRQGELSPYQVHWVEYSRSVLEGDLDRARIVIRRAAELAPASKATYNWALTALRMGRPSEAREALRLLDPDQGSMRGDPRYWIRRIDASHQLGEHARELEEVAELDARFPDERSLFFNRLRVFGALGRVESLESLFDSESMRGSAPETVARRYRQAAGELFAHGHREAARAIAEQGIAWIENQESVVGEDHEYAVGADGVARYGQLAYQKARLLEVVDRGGEALAIYERLYEQQPNSWWLRGQIGMVAAWLGDERAARQAEAWLEQAAPAYGSSTVTTWRAGIAARLGEFERAVTLLHQARREGQFWASTHSWFHLSAALGDYGPFVRFMAPQG